MVGCSSFSYQSERFSRGLFNDTDPAGPVTRKRGVIFSTPGSGLRVSDVNFADLEPSYANQFIPAFARAFSPIGSSVVDVTFKLPGTNINAYVHGFGSILVDVDNGASTLMEFFSDEQSLGLFMALPRKTQGQSFI
jgi:hypothetical protein